MFMYILMVPSVLAAMVMIFLLHRLRKHDKVLFQFCENRREAMTFLREGFNELSSPDYHDVRNLLEVANNRIHYFNECKPYHFNLRRFIAYIRAERKRGTEFRTMPNENPSIASLYDQHVYAMLNAFFAFTPLIKSELVLTLAIFVATSIAKIGIERVKRKASEWAEVFQWVEMEASQRQLLYR